MSKLQDTGSKGQLYVDLIELIHRIADYVIPKDNPSRERIGDVMGGQILKLRSEKLREEGRTLEIYSMVQDGDTSPERAAKRLGIFPDTGIRRYKIIKRDRHGDGSFFILSSGKPGTEL